MRFPEIENVSLSLLFVNLGVFAGTSPTYFRREISRSVNPNVNTSSIDLKRGRKAIATYKQAAPDDLWGRVDLMIYFVEEGAVFTLDYGDIDGPFYNSLCRMIDSIVDLSDQLSTVEYAHLSKRFEELDSHTRGQIGWGFSDHISDASDEFKSGLNG